MSGETLGLNAPYGARCFLTANDQNLLIPLELSLNAPYGARCFLTKPLASTPVSPLMTVLMHLMAVGAF